MASSREFPTNTSTTQLTPNSLPLDTIIHTSEFLDPIENFTVTPFVSRFFNSCVQIPNEIMLNRISQRLEQLVGNNQNTYLPGNTQASRILNQLAGLTADQLDTLMSFITSPIQTGDEKMDSQVLSSLILKTDALRNRLTPEAICFIGVADKNAALYILKTSVLNQRLGGYDRDTVMHAAENAPTQLNALSPLVTGAYLEKIGQAHPEAAAYILNNSTLKARLRNPAVLAPSQPVFRITT